MNVLKRAEVRRAGAALAIAAGGIGGFILTGMPGLRESPWPADTKAALAQPARRRARDIASLLADTRSHHPALVQDSVDAGNPSLDDLSLQSLNGTEDLIISAVMGDTKGQPDASKVLSVSVQVLQQSPNRSNVYGGQSAPWSEVIIEAGPDVSGQAIWSARNYLWLPGFERPREQTSLLNNPSAGPQSFEVRESINKVTEWGNYAVEESLKATERGSIIVKPPPEA